MEATAPTTPQHPPLLFLLQETQDLLREAHQAALTILQGVSATPDRCKPCRGTGRPPRVHAAMGDTKCPHCAGTGLSLAA